MYTLNDAKCFDVRDTQTDGASTFYRVHMRLSFPVMSKRTKWSIYIKIGNPYNGNPETTRHFDFLIRVRV